MLRSSSCAVVIAFGWTLSACTGPQSTLNTAGRGAEDIAGLFWGMALGAVVIWAAVVMLALYSVRGGGAGRSPRAASLLIGGGGVVFPTTVLLALLIVGLPMLPRLVDSPRTGRVRIAVSGEQWWWRVRYLTGAPRPVELANEIRVPVGERVEISLTSDNVIHSFWIPALAGKLDMIPGRTTTLSIEPTRTGDFRGACAEYCGTSHALMAFPVAVLEQDAFDDWLTEQSLPASEPESSDAQRGATLFAANGCGACHTIRGTPAAGVIGPDLTHVGSRMSLAAASLTNDRERLVEWISQPDRVKPGAHMPAFGVLGSERLNALASYLIGLR